MRLITKGPNYSYLTDREAAESVDWDGKEVERKPPVHGWVVFADPFEDNGAASMHALHQPKMTV